MAALLARRRASESEINALVQAYRSDVLGPPGPTDAGAAPPSSAAAAPTDIALTKSRRVVGICMPSSRSSSSPDEGCQLVRACDGPGIEPVIPPVASFSDWSGNWRPLPTVVAKHTLHTRCSLYPWALHIDRRAGDQTRKASARRRRGRQPCRPSRRLLDGCLL